MTDHPGRAETRDAASTWTTTTRTRSTQWLSSTTRNATETSSRRRDRLLQRLPGRRACRRLALRPGLRRRARRDHRYGPALGRAGDRRMTRRAALVGAAKAHHRGAHRAPVRPLLQRTGLRRAAAVLAGRRRVLRGDGRRDRPGDRRPGAQLRVDDDGGDGPLRGAGRRGRCGRATRILGACPRAISERERRAHPAGPQARAMSSTQEPRGRASGPCRRDEGARPRHHRRRRHLQPADGACCFWPISIVSMALTTVGALALGLVFAALSRRVPAEGGPYAYARLAFGNRHEFVSAWSYWITGWEATCRRGRRGPLCRGLRQHGPREAVVDPAHPHRPLACAFINLSGVKNMGAFQISTTA